MKEFFDSSLPDCSRRAISHARGALGVIMLNPNGTVESVDQGLAKFLGLEAEVVTGTCATLLIPEEDIKALLQPRMERIHDAESDPFRTGRAIRLRSRSGAMVSAHATISELAVGGMAYTAVVVIDIPVEDAFAAGQGACWSDWHFVASRASPVPDRGPACDTVRMSGPAEGGSLQRITRDLAQSRRDFEQLADTVPGIIWTASPAGVVDFASRELLDRCGMSVAALTSSRWHEFFHAEDQQRTAAAWNQAIESGSSFVIDARLYSHDEDCYRWHALRASPVRDDDGLITKWVGSALDIHAERKLQEDLKLAAARLTHTLESITDGLMTVDHEWRVRYFNREAERVFQMPRDQLLGEYLASVFPGPCGSQFQFECARAMRSRHTQHFEMHLQSMDLWLEVHAYPSSDGLTIYFRDIGDRKRAEAEIEFLAFRDPLTHLPNRRRMLQQLEQALREAEGRECYAGLILVDFDNFKCLNDSLGHEAADAVLQETAQILEHCFNAEETVARIGGDEFALVLPFIGTTAAGASSRINEARTSIVDAVRKAGDADGQGIRKTCSIGADMIAPGACEAGEAMQKADLALADAKKAGGNRFRIFDESMRVQADAWVTSQIEIPRAMEAGEFVPYYQPKLAVDGRCIGAEALIRWHHPERGVVEPNEFVPVAEQTGIIKRLGKAFLRDVCVDVARWAHMSEMRDRIISVNVSPSQLHEPGFVDDLTRIIEQTGAPASRLKIEVTETMLMQDIDAVVATMDALTKFGIAFSLDDFGTGHSALAYLKRLPLEELKIDQSFVRDITGDASSRAIVQSIVALATSLDMEVLAEGVETWAMHDCLAAEGCRFFQGYLFAHPMPAADFARFPQRTCMEHAALLKGSA